MIELSYQKQQVLKRAEQNYEKILGFTASIRSRATFVTTASTSLIALISVAKFLPNDSEFSGSQSILLFLVYTGSVMIYLLAARIWRCNTANLPGSNDINQLYKDYISKEEPEATYHLLRDICGANYQNILQNDIQAQNLNNLIKWFMFQLIMLAIMILWTSIEILMTLEVFIWISGMIVGALISALFKKNEPS